MQVTLQESSQAPQFESINSSVLSLVYDPTLTSMHDYWKNHNFDSTDLCQQSDVSAFYVYQVLIGFSHVIPPWGVGFIIMPLSSLLFSCLVMSDSF